jgi:NAD(P)-dependent dehydrogenase (short-subunit alcohol dehydrogenase family)
MPGLGSRIYWAAAGGLGKCEIAMLIVEAAREDVRSNATTTAVVGTVEELSASPVTQNLVRDQFETIFFSQVNFIKATLPLFRQQHTGHIMILTSIGGHIGTPGMPIYTAATWALEGFCDSLAYEIAPFNIKVTIVQPNKEIQTLTNRIIFTPPLPWYDSDVNPAPSMRDMLANVLNMTPETALHPERPRQRQSSEVSRSSLEAGFASASESGRQMSAEMDDVAMAGVGGDEEEEGIQSRYPKLPAAAVDKLVMETVHALTAIGGHENPPARHIVGFEGSVAVKEKLKTVTEELEDFVEASLAVDIFDSELTAEAREGKANESPAAVPVAAST